MLCLLAWLSLLFGVPWARSTAPEYLAAEHNVQNKMVAIALRLTYRKHDWTCVIPWAQSSGGLVAEAVRRLEIKVDKVRSASQSNAQFNQSIRFESEVKRYSK